MNAIAVRALPDVHANADDRGIALDAVGVSGVAFPISVRAGDGSEQPTIGEAELTVALGAEVKGTHMSRFVEETATLGPVTPAAVLALCESLRTRLTSTSSQVLIRFPLFLRRPAPVTGLTAAHRYGAWIRAGSSDTHDARLYLGVRAAVTSLCPCSREISDYGAHSQRGHVEVEVEAPGWRDGESIWPQELFDYADRAGSAQIHPLLKRLDERAVTMRAYDNPAFVEDIAREVVLAVEADSRCAAWSVTVVNQESIHSHQAIARVCGRR
jgi:GTP cyclohydrolase FolE2